MMVTTEKRVAITHLAMVTHLQTTDYVEAMEKEAEQSISRICSECKGIQFEIDLFIVAKIAKVYTWLWA